jgi:hypothetical protein
MREIQAQERTETMALKEQLENHKLRGERHLVIPYQDRLDELTRLQHINSKLPA